MDQAIENSVSPSLQKSTNAAQPVPRSWFYLWVGFMVLAALGILTAGLLVRFILARPLNLEPLTALLAEQVPELLASHFVPLASVEMAAPELREEEGRRWNYFSITASAPSEVNRDGLLTVLKRDMEALNVTVRMEAPVDEAPRAGLYFGGVRFAELTVFKEPPPPKLDFRGECARLRTEVETELIAAGVLPESIERGPTEAREDETAVWEWARIGATAPEALSTALLRDRLDKRFGERGVAVLADEESATLLLRLKQRECIRVEIEREAPVPVAGGIPVDHALPDISELPLDSEELPEPSPNGDQTMPHPQPEPKVAIILDDGGYGNGYTEKILSLEGDLTLAILPNTPFAAYTAVRGAEEGFEILLHMPMEISVTAKPFPGQITTAMEESEIQQLTREALAQIPGITGVNNHTGSLYTRNREHMDMFLKILKEQDLFFVDSRTIIGSVGYEAAVAMGIPAAARDIFLDHDGSQQSIRKQFQALIDRAKTKGHAIGIGHFRHNTATVLEQELPRLEAEGVRLVHVSELLH